MKIIVSAVLNQVVFVDAVGVVRIRSASWMEFGGGSEREGAVGGE